MRVAAKIILTQQESAELTQQSRSKRTSVRLALYCWPPLAQVEVARLVELTTQSKPEAATRWSTRKMAAVIGISAASVSRHWRANGLKPHLIRSFKVSRDR